MNKALLILSLIISQTSLAASFECMDLANSLSMKKMINSIYQNLNKCVTAYYQKNKKQIGSECDSRVICSEEMVKTHLEYLSDKRKLCVGIKAKYGHTDLLVLPPEALVFEGKKPQSVEEVFNLDTTKASSRQELLFLKSQLPRDLQDEVDIKRFCPNYLTYSTQYSEEKKILLDSFNPTKKR